MKILRNYEYYDANLMIKRLKSSEIVQKDMLVKYDKIKEILEDLKD